jgi:hypothetical protein
MPMTRTFFRSFAGGELSPEMFGRIDDVKFQTGAAKLRNFIAMPQGPAENRAGTAFVRAVKNSAKRTRLIPFTYSTTQTMVLELGDGYIRFHTQGATLLVGTPSAFSTTKTITAVDIATETVTSNAHGYANGTPIQIAATTTIPAGLSALTTYYVVGATTNTFQFSLTVGGAAIDITSTGAGTITTNQVYSLGDLVSSGGSNYYCILASTGNLPTNATYWYPIPSAAYEIPTPYAEADLFDLHYVQSADVLTIVHPNYAPRELRRLGATTWTLSTILFVSPVAAPAAPTVTANRGRSINILSITNAAIAVIETVADHNLGLGDPVEISGVLGMTEANGFWIVHKNTPGDKLEVQSYTTGAHFNSTNPPVGIYTSGGSVQYANQSQDLDNFYVITSIATNGFDESVASPSGTVFNNLNVTGASNDLTWTAVSGALRYNIYKKQNGLYGYIGQSDTNSFTDNNIAPDMGITPPIVDPVFMSAGNYPQAVSYFEQRRVFAGTTNEPQSMWMTRSGTESDMSYSLPVKDDDRINFRVAAREANTIRHVIPLTQLILLTSAAEWRVSPVNSDAITPTTVSVRPQSYVGASNVQPEIINNSMVYCAARGGHIRELGYSWQSNGFITGDLSIRAAHLFDNFNIVDMCYAKSPQPLLWFVSTTGKLLGLTYVPEQQIGAWHQHDTDGVFESCTVVAEGNEDSLYVIVQRTINGNSVRYVERMATRQVNLLKDCFFVDAGSTFNGTNLTATTVTVTGGTSWGPADVLTITASSNLFVWPGTTDVNDAIVLTDSTGASYRLKILATSSATVATAKVDKVIPVALRATPTTVWAFARDTVSGLSHLEGKTVSILADGAVMPQVVVTGGVAVLERASVVVHVGLPYQSDLQTLPVALNIDAFAQGRVKNVNQAWIRVFQSSGIFVGPDANKLTEAKQRTTEPYGSPPALKSDEVSVAMTPTWAQSGQIYIRQSDPLPLTIVGITTEIVVGS